MNVTSAQYYTTLDPSTNEGIKSTIDGQETYVPLDTANRHYRAILEWVAEGNTIEEAD